MPEEYFFPLQKSYPRIDGGADAKTLINWIKVLFPQNELVLEGRLLQITSRDSVASSLYQLIYI